MDFIDELQGAKVATEGRLPLVLRYYGSHYSELLHSSPGADLPDMAMASSQALVCSPSSLRADQTEIGSDSQIATTTEVQEGP